MKALTVWQPFASLIVGAPPTYDAHPTEGQKPVENRGWKPPEKLLGQRIAIHAGKLMNGDVLEMFHTVFKARTFGEVRVPYATPKAFPRGAVVGVATLDRVIGPLPDDRTYEERFDGIPQATIDSWGLDEAGLRWFVGTYGWVFRDRRWLATPVPCSGAQGLWDLSPSDEALVEAQLRPSALRVYTAPITYAGADRLDVTRKSAGPHGLPFAPSWRILAPMLRRRREGGPSAVAYAWPQYVADYTAEMRTSYRDHRAAWDALLARGEVTLVCYCRDAIHCHRRVLAEILAQLGAVQLGERGAPAQEVAQP